MIELQQLVKKFGALTAVAGIDLSIPRGLFSSQGNAQRFLGDCGVNQPGRRHDKQCTIRKTKQPGDRTES